MTSIPRIFVALVAAMVTATASFSQSPQAGSEGGSVISDLRDSVEVYDKEIGLLQHSLEGATIDWARLRHTGVRSWVVSNPALRDSLFYSLMAIDSSIQSEAGAEALVLATSTDDIIEVRFGNAVFKGMTLQNAVEKSHNKTLYADIAASYRYSKDVELRDPAYTLETEYEPLLLEYERMLQLYDPLSILSVGKPATFRSDLSLSGLKFKSGPLWGGEFKIGNEEIGFPFWTSGKMAFLATYKNLKLGFELPFTGGLNTSEIFPPFVIRSRKLNGTRGVVGGFDFGPFGGSFSFTRLTENDLHALTDPDNFYYITVIAQAYFSFGLELTPSNFIRVKAGAGTHKVNQAHIETTAGGTQAVPGPTEDFVSPYLKFEYLNQTIGENFAVTVQYYDVTLVTTAMLEVVKDVLSFELLYMWPLAAELPEWQNPEFLILTPHLYLTF
jgi:hypothetical protein